MRYLISVLSALVMGSLIGQAAHAEFPERGVKIVVPFPAGGSNDVVGAPVGDPTVSTLGAARGYRQSRRRRRQYRSRGGGTFGPPMAIRCC